MHYESASSPLARHVELTILSFLQLIQANDHGSYLNALPLCLFRLGLRTGRTFGVDLRRMRKTLGEFRTSVVKWLYGMRLSGSTTL